MNHKIKYLMLACAAVCLCGCVSLKGYREAKARMLYLEYERVNGPIQIADSTQVPTELTTEQE